MITAPMAQQLADCDLRIRESLAELRILLKTPASKADLFQRICHDLKQLHEGLHESLAIQEYDGYMDHVEAHVPYYHDRIERLHKEQCQLLRELESLRDELDLASPVLRLVICRRLDVLIDRIENHDVRKNAFVMHAFNLDPGSPD